jgi:lipoprotein-anchoring transpeptidase ErfK/SrfK
MRGTWVVLGVMVALGGVGYWKLRAKAAENAAPLARTANAEPVAGGSPASPTAPMATTPTPPASAPAGGAGGGGSPPPTASSTASSVVAAPSPAAAASEARAADVRAQIAAKVAANDSAGAAALEKLLDGDLADTDEARRHAFARGLRAWESVEGRDVSDPTVLDRARRDLSRGLWLPEMFDPATGLPTDARTRAIGAVQQMNARVMTWRAGVPGVTVPYKVAPGDKPVQIVTDRKLDYGHNALLFWNHGGNLDPSRLRAGETLLLPQETLSLRVDRARHRLAIELGGVFVKEFGVGVGKPATPTYPGVYEVDKKHLNPDWWSPNGLVKYGDPRNELGDAWIPIGNAEHPTGYGIHGTNKPDTVGTNCSEGCVRLRNEEVREVFWWVRTASAGGHATKVVIR